MYEAARLLKNGAKINSPRSPTSYAPSGKLGGVSKNKTESFSTDEINQLLDNYTEVPSNEWHNLHIGDHIRYMKSDGDFKRGGFIRKKSEEKDVYFLLENFALGSKTTNSKYISWTMHLSNVSKIFLKNKGGGNGDMDDQLNQPIPPMNQFIPPINQSISPQFNPSNTVELGFMQSKIDDLEKRYLALESNYKKIQEDNADLTIFVRKIAKYIQNKGGDIQ